MISRAEIFFERYGRHFPRMKISEFSPGLLEPVTIRITLLECLIEDPTFEGVFLVTWPLDFSLDTYIHLETRNNEESLR